MAVKSECNPYLCKTSDVCISEVSLYAHFLNLQLLVYRKYKSRSTYIPSASTGRIKHILTQHKLNTHWVVRGNKGKSELPADITCVPNWWSGEIANSKKLAVAWPGNVLTTKLWILDNHQPPQSAVSAIGCIVSVSQPAATQYVLGFASCHTCTAHSSF